MPDISRDVMSIEVMQFICVSQDKCYEVKTFYSVPADNSICQQHLYLIS